MVGAEQLTAKSDELATLPLSVVRQIDALADEFEAAWQRGEAPRSETFVERLGDASDEARAALTAQLAQMQTELVESAGRTPQPFTAPPRPIRLDGEAVSAGEYRLLAQLGSGGMGVVYQAMHVRLDRLVAIKFPRFAAALDPRAAARFLHEARMIGRLDHPHIVRALDAGDSEYGPYLVTEFIAGETLEDMVRRTGPLPVEQAVAWIRQAATALAYAHSRNIVHRDVKPSNLLLDGAGTLRVVDFGLAKILADDRQALDASRPSHHTQDGTFLGTVGYAAPEQLLPGREIDHRADIYALGGVLYFALTGEVLHSGTMAERLLGSRKPKSVSLGRLRDDVPPALESVLRRMITPEPERRFGSMEEVDQALAAASAAGGERGHGSAIACWTAAAAVGGTLLVGLLAWNAAGLGNRARPRPPVQGLPPAVAVAPFDARRAEEHQQSWSEHLGVGRRHVNSVGMPLVLLPPGEFTMGMSDAPVPEPAPEAGDWRYQAPEVVRGAQLPRHRVQLTRPLYFGETEVTNAQFRKFVEATGYVTDAERSRGWGKEDRGWLRRAGYSWKNMGQRLCEDDHPVINVTRNDAIALCKWLSDHEQRGTYRLPTEAEWEYACRAGTESTYFMGNDEHALGEFAWLSINSEGRFRAVATRRPNPFGLYDLIGNRQEWCLDAYDADFYASSPVVDPICESGSAEYVLRGGTHTDLPSFATSARRWSQSADNLGGAGIRVVCEVD